MGEPNGGPLDPERDESLAATDETQLAAGPAITNDSQGVPQVVGGRYQILGLIGSGGMGTVYRAHDLELDETVALKMLRVHLVDQPDVIERFRREVKLARRVTHPNVARTFDIGEHDGEKFLTMEYVDGPSLARICQSGALPLGRIVEIATHVCAGLAAAHAAGVVHRDLKPDNVLVGNNGRVVITDFGIASAWELGSSARTIGRGVPVGTPAYMAPEQVEEAETIDARADLYALGVMLYELTTGKQPWTGRSIMNVAVARLTQPPPDPRAAAPQLPDTMAELILRLMARRPADRFADAASVSEALGRVTHATGPLAPVARASVGGHGDKSVAILPLRNHGAPEDEYLAEALTDDLIDALSMTRGLRVRARGAVARYRGVERDAREIGRELGVEVVVEGSVRRVGGALRLTARLIGVADGFQIWAHRFDRPASDALAAIDEEAAAIARALTVERTAPPRESPLDPEALDLYLRARNLSRVRSSKNVPKILALYEAALARAPDHPMLLPEYAIHCVTTWFFGGSSEAARRATERALAFAPERPETRVALARLHRHAGDPAAAVTEFRKAVALSPSLVEAHELMGNIALEVGLLDEATRRAQYALALDPSLVFARITLARAHAYLGEWERADALLEDSRSPLIWQSRLRFASWRGDHQRAKALAGELAGEDTLMTWLVPVIREVLLTERLDGPEMARLDVRLATPSGNPLNREIDNQIKAELACYVGDPARAMAPLADAVDAGLIDLCWIDRCLLLAPLRVEPKFAELRARVAARARPVVAAFAG
jgi:serine/threonine-protein kinase